jgi:hypothetical protein
MMEEQADGIIIVAIKDKVKELMLTLRIMVTRVSMVNLSRKKTKNTSEIILIKFNIS